MNFFIKKLAFIIYLLYFCNIFICDFGIIEIICLGWCVLHQPLFYAFSGRVSCCYEGFPTKKS